MTSHLPAAQRMPRRYMLPLLLAYPSLAIAGALTHRQIFPLLALALLLTIVMLPSLLARRVGPWLLWSASLAALLALSLRGFAGLLLEAVPVLINAWLASWFGRSLATPEPLVARFIVVIEGAGRLNQPGVARYARRLTWFWTILLGAQASLLAILLLYAKYLPDRWAAVWLHVGGYLLIGAAFLLEYGYRRWHLRHLSHPRLHHMLLLLLRRGPQLLRGNGTASS